MRLSLALILECHHTLCTLCSWTCPLVISMHAGIDGNVRLHLVIAKTEPNLPAAICTRGPESCPVGAGRLILDRAIALSQAGDAGLEQQLRMERHAVCFVQKRRHPAHFCGASKLYFKYYIFDLNALDDIA